ncbi:hypothetical protein C8J57DRAFT_1513006 [Mycena rebaudengoi]|nr:hypothetical protein C8J57DRAFT_1513006 [Mycena rebaudengoi]
MAIFGPLDGKRPRDCNQGLAFILSASEGRNGAWDNIRTVWGNWKFLVENCQRFPGEEAFWSKYSTSDSTHLRYQQILDALKDARELKDKADAEAARKFFNGNMDHPDADGALAYTKSGQLRIKGKDSPR